MVTHDGTPETLQEQFAPATTEIVAKPPAAVNVFSPGLSAEGQPDVLTGLRR